MTVDTLKGIVDRRKKKELINNNIARTMSSIMATPKSCTEAHQKAR